MDLFGTLHGGLVSIFESPNKAGKDIYTYMFTCIHIYMYKHMNMFIHIPILTYLQYIYIYVYGYIYIYIFTCVGIPPSSARPNGDINMIFYMLFMIYSHEYEYNVDQPIWHK